MTKAQESRAFYLKIQKILLDMDSLSEHEEGIRDYIVINLLGDEIEALEFADH